MCAEVGPQRPRLVVTLFLFRPFWTLFPNKALCLSRALSLSCARSLSLSRYLSFSLHHSLSLSVSLFLCISFSLCASLSLSLSLLRDDHVCGCYVLCASATCTASTATSSLTWRKVLAHARNRKGNSKPLQLMLPLLPLPTRPPQRLEHANMPVLDLLRRCHLAS